MLKKFRFNSFGGSVYWQIFDRSGQATPWGEIHCFIIEGRFGVKSVEFFLAGGSLAPVNPRLTFELDDLSESDQLLVFERMLDQFIKLTRVVQP